MSYSFWVMFEKQRIPAVATLLAAIAKSHFPLKVSADWDWADHYGWLPMHWQDEISGCEVGVEALSAEMSERAADAGFANLDSAIVISTSDWRSLQCGVAFAAILAEITQGVISEDEDELLPPDAAADWANDSIQNAERARHQETAATAARETAMTAGDLDGHLSQALQAWADQSAQITLAMEHIGANLASGHRIAGSHWRLHVGDKTLAHTRYKSIRQQQLAMLQSTELGDQSDSDSDEAHEALWNALEQAGDLDTSDAQAALEIIETWPGDLRVTSARWIPPGSIELSLAAPGQPKIEWLSAGILANITVTAPPLQFSIGDSLTLL